jgi:hypothetical protein
MNNLLDEIAEIIAPIAEMTTPRSIARMIEEELKPVS